MNSLDENVLEALGVKIIESSLLDEKPLNYICLLAHSLSYAKSFFKVRIFIKLSNLGSNCVDLGNNTKI
jgi:hypothetical protein